MHRLLPFWQRLLLTIVAMFAGSWIAGLLWHSIFSLQLPSYVAGMVGGLAALPVSSIGLADYWRQRNALCADCEAGCLAGAGWGEFGV